MFLKGFRKLSAGVFLKCESQTLISLSILKHILCVKGSWKIFTVTWVAFFETRHAKLRPRVVKPGMPCFGGVGAPGKRALLCSLGNYWRGLRKATAHVCTTHVKVSSTLVIGRAWEAWVCSPSMRLSLFGAGGVPELFFVSAHAQLCVLPVTVSLIGKKKKRLMGTLEVK